MVELKLPIPEDFLHEEIRCGYTVSRQMKEIWAVQLDLFAEFDRVCRKYNITYIASGGTMLGAVRHHGYIPWDDDMDLMMTRKEYDKLCNIAPSEFKHPYFFQTEQTEPGSHRWFARLRNSETTAIQIKEQSYHQLNNQGIFIDIFPMDNVIDDEILFKAQSKVYHKYYCLYCYFNSIGNSFGSKNDSFIRKIAKYFLRMVLGAFVRKNHLVEWAYNKAETACKMYNNKKTERMSLLSFQFDNLGHAILTSDMGHLTYVDFEFLKIPIIQNYDEHLRRKYGDYMIPMKNPNYHGDIIFDTNISYKSYI